MWVDFLTSKTLGVLDCVCALPPVGNDLSIFDCYTWKEMDVWDFRVWKQLANRCVCVVTATWDVHVDMINKIIVKLKVFLLLLFVSETNEHFETPTKRRKRLKLYDQRSSDRPDMTKHPLHTNEGYTRFLTVKLYSLVS